jgi:16S rRNA (cytidine1402-2'-O)-methyltransferase
MTKVHEEVLRGTLTELAERVASAPVRGECVVVVAGAPPVARTPKTLSDRDIESALESPDVRNLPARAQAKILARRAGISSREAYARLQQRKGDGRPVR